MELLYYGEGVVVNGGHVSEAVRLVSTNQRTALAVHPAVASNHVIIILCFGVCVNVV